MSTVTYRVEVNAREGWGVAGVDISDELLPIVQVTFFRYWIPGSAAKTICEETESRHASVRFDTSNDLFLDDVPASAFLDDDDKKAAAEILSEKLHKIIHPCQRCCPPRILTR